MFEIKPMRVDNAASWSQCQYEINIGGFVPPMYGLQPFSRPSTIHTHMLTWKQFNESKQQFDYQLLQQQQQQQQFPTNTIKRSPLEEDITTLSRMCRNLQSTEAFNALYQTIQQLKSLQPQLH